MNESEKKGFYELISKALAYYGREVDMGVVGIYWGGLRQYDLSAIRDAMGRHAANPDTGQYMPKIADIVKMLSGTSGDRALQAWAKVDKAVRQVGPYQSVVFDDPLIHVVLEEMGGWIALGDKKDSEWPFIAKEFENRYRGYANRNETPPFKQSLPGIAEAENKAPAEPVLIGDKSKAETVYRGGTEAPRIAFSRASKLLRLPQ